MAAASCDVQQTAARLPRGFAAEASAHGVM